VNQQRRRKQDPNASTNFEIQNRNIDRDKATGNITSIRTHKHWNKTQGLNTESNKLNKITIGRGQSETPGDTNKLENYKGLQNMTQNRK